jgi:hypothetical protein
MLTILIDTVFGCALFGCAHSHYSFPRAVRSRRAAASRLTGTYVVCLDCGKEMAYDWSNMTVVKSESQLRHYTRSMVGKQAA